MCKVLCHYLYIFRLNPDTLYYSYCVYDVYTPGSLDVYKSLGLTPRDVKPST